VTPDGKFRLMSYRIPSVGSGSLPIYIKVYERRRFGTFCWLRAAAAVLLRAAPCCCCC